MEWSEITEELLTNWKDQCSARHILHTKCRSDFSNKDKLLAVPSIVLSGLAGTTLIGTTIGSTQNLYLEIVLGCFSIISAILAAIQKTQNYSILVKDNSDTASAYIELVHTIDSELVMPRASRSNCEAFVKTTRMSYDIILNGAPSIPEGVYKWYETVYLKKLGKQYKKFIKYTHQMSSNESNVTDLSDTAPNPLLGGMFSNVMLKRMGSEVVNNSSPKLTASVFNIPEFRKNERFENELRNMKMDDIRLHNRCDSLVVKKSDPLYDIENPDCQSDFSPGEAPMALKNKFNKNIQDASYMGILGDFGTEHVDDDDTEFFTITGRSESR